MLTIIGSLIGFGTSALPRVFDMFDEWQDRKHEKEMQITRAMAGILQSVKTGILGIKPCT